MLLRNSCGFGFRGQFESVFFCRSCMSLLYGENDLLDMPAHRMEESCLPVTFMHENAGFLGRIVMDANTQNGLRPDTELHPSRPVSRILEWACNPR